MTSRREQEMVRKWLLDVARGDDTEAAEPAVYALAWIAELARDDSSEPRLPAEPTQAMLDVLREACAEGGLGGWPRDGYRALYAHLTAPKRKMIRIRARGVDMLVEPPISQSEVEVDQ